MKKNFNFKEFILYAFFLLALWSAILILKQFYFEKLERISKKDDITHYHKDIKTIF